MYEKTLATFLNNWRQLLIMHAFSTLLDSSARIFLQMPPTEQRQILDIINPALRIAGAPEDVILTFWRLLEQLESGRAPLNLDELSPVAAYLGAVDPVVDCYGFKLAYDELSKVTADQQDRIPPFGSRIFSPLPQAFDLSAKPNSSDMERIRMTIHVDEKTGTPIDRDWDKLFKTSGVRLNQIYQRDEHRIVEGLKRLSHTPRIVILGPANSKTEIQYALRLLDLARKPGNIDVYESSDVEGLAQILHEENHFLNKQPHRVNFYSEKGGNFFEATITEADVVIVVHSDQMAANLIPRLRDMIRLGGYALWQHDFDWNTLMMGIKKFQNPLSVDEILTQLRPAFTVTTHHRGMVLETLGAYVWFAIKNVPVEYFFLERV